MKPLIRAAFAAASLAMASAAMNGAAQAETEANTIEGKPEDGQTVALFRDIALAQDLAAYGIENSDAMPLIVAARILDGYDVLGGELQARGSGQEDSGAVAEGSRAVVGTSADALALARDLAGERQDLLALIEDVAASGSRGTRGLGYYYYEDFVGAYDVLVYDEGFFGEEQAIVAVKSWEEADLDLMVYDEHGNLVCESASKLSSEQCQWTPRRTGTFLVVVTNNGQVETNYSLWTN